MPLKNLKNITLYEKPHKYWCFLASFIALGTWF